MADTAKTDRKNTKVKEKPSPRRRYLRWALVIVAAIGLVWLASWLLQRSYQRPSKKRAMQLWMDEKLNADVSLLGSMVVRTNIVRRSRLVLYDVEVEHPNPIFPGKFARIGRIGGWASPLSVVHLRPDELDVVVDDMRLNVEESEGGEWSVDGLMQPLAAGNTKFPFPVPNFSGLKATFKDGRLTVRRRGYELDMQLQGVLTKSKTSDQLLIHNDRCQFTFNEVDTEGTPRSGLAAPINLRLKLGDNPGDLPQPVAGRCATRVKGLPVAMLPFFISGFPIESPPGDYHGLIRYDEHPGSMGALHLDGELADAPLAVFGLPRNSPLKVTWPLGSGSDNRQATIHLGPSGFGAFEITVPLDADGRPKQLVMRGDVADLNDIPAFFTKYTHWPNWLSMTFPNIQWRTGSWRGFGWRGDNLQLSLTRSTAGLNLSGEGEMMGGKVRLSMTPGQVDSPITISAERLDPVRLSARLSRLLPDAFRARVNGTGVNLTWRGYPTDTGEMKEWAVGMVWSKPIVDISASGEFWKVTSDIARAIANALPEWGGGQATDLIALSREGGVPLDQLSIVSESDGNGGVAAEIRAYGEAFGQATGLVERRRDGAIEGEFLLAGPSRLLRATEQANPVLAFALDLLANESSGLRVRLLTDDEGNLVFSYPFLEDARRLHDELRKSEE